MTGFFLTILSFLFRGIFSLRYKVKINGLDAVEKRLSENKRGALFLPNHTALLDPALIEFWFWPKYRLRPLVVELFCRMPLLGGFIRVIKGISIPDFETSINQYKAEKAKESLTKVVKGLYNHENFLVYPSGKIKKGGKEEIGGALGVHEILTQCPGAEIVLVRISGFYGSTFSKAITGSSPNLKEQLFRHIKTILKNGIFFTPRREITIDVLPHPPNFPTQGTRFEMNRYLEKWYNQYVDADGKIVEEEPLKLVSFSFWKNDFPEMIKKNHRSKTPSKKISPQTQLIIYAEIRKILENPNLQIRPEMNLGNDLGMDSLNIAELMSFLVHKYEVDAKSLAEVDTVQKVLEHAESAKDDDAQIDQTPIDVFVNEKGRPMPFEPCGLTMPEAFLQASKKVGKYVAMSDDRVGDLTYNKCRRSILVLAEYFKTFPEKYIAIMLPASAGCVITILALQIAGKIPVMLNWTIGPRYLEQMMQISGAQRILTSWAFLERINYVDFGKTVSQIELLEDIKSAISLKMKLKGLFFPPKIKISEDEQAVILFTSGTETMPKGVPLSHKNILSAIRGAFTNFSPALTPESSTYAFLPLFHSFGFTCGVFVSLFTGMRTAYSPDPTDSLSLARGIEKWKITNICIVPNFLKKLLDAAKNKNLSTLKIVMVGGEKPSPELYKQLKAVVPGARLIEGYGVTECSPIITMQNPLMETEGVGQLISNLEARTIHPETHAPLPEGSEGEICVRGPAVFSRYLGSVPASFIEIDGAKWYRTGDVGYITSNRSVFLKGRLKRFIKLGGEMISLGAVESALYKELLLKGNIKPEPPAIALCADERNVEKPRLILFSTIELNTESANEILKNSGFSRLVKISSVEKVSEIPLMTIGKTNYRSLQDQILQKA